MTGVHASSTVDVDCAKAIGQNIMTSMTDKSLMQYSFKRYDPAVTLQSKPSVRVGGDQVHVDPELLFQRLIVAARSTDDTETMFRFELYSHPPV